MPTPPSDDRYDWLYDGPGPADQPHGAKSSDASSPAPASHQPAPHQSAPHQSAQSLPPPNLPPPGTKSRPGGPTRPPSATTKPPRKARRWRRIILTLVLAWVVFLVAVPFWAWSKIHKVDAEPAGTRPGEQPGTTILLVGSDKRASWKERGRTDTIMLLHWGSGPTVLTSIPRDSQVPIPGRGRNKINAAYAWGGPKLLVQTLEQDTGVRIDGYVEIGFTGLVDVVNAVGGIEVCPKTALHDKLAHLSISAGCQDVDGDTALAYSRARHSRANGDIGRAEAQREVIGAIGSSVRSPWTFVNPIRYSRVAGTTADALTVNEGMHLWTFGRFAWQLSAVMGGHGRSCTVPLADLSVRWDRERALAFFGHLKNDTTSELGGLCTADGFRG